MEIYQKLFSEMRFPGQIDIFDGQSKIVKAYYPEKFKNWTIENNVIIRLHDNDKHQNSMESLLITDFRASFNRHIDIRFSAKNSFEF